MSEGLKVRVEYNNAADELIAHIDGDITNISPDNPYAVICEDTTDWCWSKEELETSIASMVYERGLCEEISEEDGEVPIEEICIAKVVPCDFTYKEISTHKRFFRKG